MKQSFISVSIILLLLLGFKETFGQNSMGSKVNQSITTANKEFELLKKDSPIKMIGYMSKNDSLLQKELNDYNNFGIKHREKTLTWNLTSSKITFWVVIFLVLSGVAFAGLQFYISIKFNQKEPNGSFKDLNTELQAGKDGLKISSPVLGVIILIISLLFFYLYLAYVYPIKEIF